MDTDRSILQCPVFLHRFVEDLLEFTGLQVRFVFDADCFFSAREELIIFIKYRNKSIQKNSSCFMDFIPQRSDYIIPDFQFAVIEISIGGKPFQLGISLGKGTIIIDEIIEISSI